MRAASRIVVAAVLLSGVLVAAEDSRLAFRTPDTALLMSQIIGGPDWAATSQFIIDAKFVREPTSSDIRLQLP